MSLFFSALFFIDHLTLPRSFTVDIFTIICRDTLLPDNVISLYLIFPGETIQFLQLLSFSGDSVGGNPESMLRMQANGRTGSARHEKSKIMWNGQKTDFFRTDRRSILGYTAMIQFLISRPYFFHRVYRNQTALGHMTVEMFTLYGRENWN